MNIPGSISLLLGICLSCSARADLTLIQSVEGAGALSEMTIKIKGDKARLEASPQVTTIIDSKTGDLLNLMNDQKKFLRVSASQAKAVAEMAMKPDGKNAPVEKPKLTPTGKKEKINGYEAQEYVCEAPSFKATYWIAMTYPNSIEIVKQLQALSPSAWNASLQGMPDYRDFPGLPLRTRVSLEGKDITSTLISVKQDPLEEAEFSVPKGFEEMKMPDMQNMFPGKPPAAAPSPKK